MSELKEMNPVNLKGNQPWIFIGRTNADAEAPILWPPDAKSWLPGKDPDAGKDWRQEEKGATEGEMVGWRHWLSKHRFKQTPRDSGGQWSLAFCSPWGRKESDMTEQLNHNKNGWALQASSTDRNAQHRPDCWSVRRRAWTWTSGIGRRRLPSEGTHWMHWRKQSKAREDQLQVESRLTDHPEQRGRQQRARAAPGRNTPRGDAHPSAGPSGCSIRITEGRMSGLSSGWCWYQHWVTGRSRVPWSRKWQPTPVFLLGEPQGQRSLAGCSPRGHKESDLKDGLSTQAAQHTLDYPKDASTSFPAGPVNCKMSQRFCRKWQFFIVFCLYHSEVIIKMTLNYRLWLQIPAK